MSWIKLVPFYLFVIHFYTRESYSAPSKAMFQCKDENNNPVDWFVLYKLPKVTESSDPVIRKGLSYLYITSETVASGWKLSQHNISSSNSIPGMTLTPLYADKVANQSMWILYNDQAPNGTSNAKYGHTKGVVMTDGAKGFWLIHSVPGYPPIPRTGIKGGSRLSAETENINYLDGEYSYPNSGTNYGQSFMCISINANQIEIIARQLMYNQIISYRKNLPISLSMNYPTFVNASNHARIKNPPYTKKVTISSTGGMEFISFAKSDKWQKDLYDDFVAPQLNSDLVVESWLNGRGKLPSDCNGPRVYNIESVTLTVANVVFTSSRDHSKWAISATNGTNRNWVCVGDINRADTQFNRGGGTVCCNLPKLWKNYRNSVNEVEPCRKRNRGS